MTTNDPTEDAPKRIPHRFRREPVKYRVGIDISEDRYNAIVQAIGDWFAKSRKTREPVLLAKQAIQRCLDGVTSSNQPWWDAWNSTLAARIRVMCSYDIETMQPRERASAKRKARKERERALAQARKRKDPLIPDEVEALLVDKNKVKYGDNPHLLLSTAEAKKWRQLHDGYTQQFPELRSINAQSELAIVCDLMILAERYRLKALNGQAVAVEELAKITKELANLKTALGIHPTQLEKRAKPKTDATIGAAVARLESMGNWRELRARFQLEEFIQAYQMYVSPRADGQGYQLDEVGFYGLTKCRTCACSKCGVRNAAGFSAEEIEQYLVDQGYLEPLGTTAPVVPAASDEDVTHVDPEPSA